MAVAFGRTLLLSPLRSENAALSAPLTNAQASNGEPVEKSPRDPPMPIGLAAPGPIGVVWFHSP